MPNLKQFLPGDLILSREPSPGIIDRSIARAQERGGFSSEHARWTHAAVFLFDDLLLEALPLRGVVQESIYNYLPETIMRVRRDVAASSDHRFTVALRALSMLGKRYSLVGAFGLGRDLLLGLWNKDVLTSNRYVVICSQVYSDAYSSTTDTVLKACPIDTPVTPAHLSATSSLVDVAIDWMKLR